MPMILRSGRIASIELAPVVLNAPDITAGQFLKFLDRVLLGIQEMLRAINDCYDSKEARSLKSGTTKRAQYLAPFKSISDEIRRLVTTVGFYKQSAIEWHTDKGEHYEERFRKRHGRKDAIRKWLESYFNVLLNLLDEVALPCYARMQGKDYADWDVDGGRAIPFHKGKGGIPEQESDAEKENLPPRKYAGKRLPARETTARVLCKR